MKRAKKRQATDSEKKSSKCDDSKDKPNSGMPFPESDNGQDFTEGTTTEGGAEGASGDTSSSDTLSLNLALTLILNHKKKELLECPEVMHLLQYVSRNP